MVQMKVWKRTEKDGKALLYIPHGSDEREARIREF